MTTEQDEPRSSLPLVLDTNIYSFRPIKDIESLHQRGFVLHVSEIAFLEAWAASVRMRDDGEPLERAKGKFFNRARAVAPFLDKSEPIAMGFGLLFRRIIAKADGKPPVPEAEARAVQLNAMWRMVVDGSCDDDDWVSVGRGSNTFLDELDEHLIDMAKPEAELKLRPRSGEFTPEELAESEAKWDEGTFEQKYDAITQHVARTIQLSSVASERVDGHLRSMGYRLAASGAGKRLPGKNDGADLRLTLHVGEGRIVLTDEKRLIQFLKDAGTFQRHWVRRFDELEGNVPTMVPWGPDAHAFAEVRAQEEAARVGLSPGGRSS